MPLVRYEVRCEHSLANPELYRSAARDDPEALLEGVAMAGLVGIVRQLGDLAEFAAEIFRDLHNELMAIGGRGYDLTTRLQQLEVELPVVEKALLSEPNQIRFAYCTGSNWHASIRSDQNHCTQGDHPRFIRNFYEECRGPPRLFLLDKFDVAGAAGGCLKKYTDPSFFKTEWAKSELMKAQRAQTDNNNNLEKIKGRHHTKGQPNGMDQIPSRTVHSPLAGSEGVDGIPHNLASGVKAENSAIMSGHPPVSPGPASIQRWKSWHAPPRAVNSAEESSAASLLKPGTSGAAINGHGETAARELPPNPPRLSPTNNDSAPSNKFSGEFHETSKASKMKEEESVENRVQRFKASDVNATENGPNEPGLSASNPSILAEMQDHDSAAKMLNSQDTRHNVSTEQTESTTTTTADRIPGPAMLRDETEAAAGMDSKLPSSHKTKQDVDSATNVADNIAQKNAMLRSECEPGVQMMAKLSRHSLKDDGEAASIISAEDLKHAPADHVNLNGAPHCKSVKHNIPLENFSDAANRDGRFAEAQRSVKDGDNFADGLNPMGCLNPAEKLDALPPLDTPKHAHLQANVADSELNLHEVPEVHEVRKLSSDMDIEEILDAIVDQGDHAPVVMATSPTISMSELGSSSSRSLPTIISNRNTVTPLSRPNILEPSISNLSSRFSVSSSSIMSVSSNSAPSSPSTPNSSVLNIASPPRDSPGSTVPQETLDSPRVSFPESLQYKGSSRSDPSNQSPAKDPVFSSPATIMSPLPSRVPLPPLQCQEYYPSPNDFPRPSYHVTTPSPTPTGIHVHTSLSSSTLVRSSSLPKLYPLPRPPGFPEPDLNPRSQVLPRGQEFSLGQLDPICAANLTLESVDPPPSDGTGKFELNIINKDDSSPSPQASPESDCWGSPKWVPGLDTPLCSHFYSRIRSSAQFNRDAESTLISGKLLDDYVKDGICAEGSTVSEPQELRPLGSTIVLNAQESREAPSLDVNEGDSQTSSFDDDHKFTVEIPLHHHGQFTMTAPSELSPSESPSGSALYGHGWKSMEELEGKTCLAQNLDLGLTPGPGCSSPLSEINSEIGCSRVELLLPSQSETPSNCAIDMEENFPSLASASVSHAPALGPNIKFLSRLLPASSDSEMLLQSRPVQQEGTTSLPMSSSSEELLSDQMVSSIPAPQKKSTKVTFQEPVIRPRPRPSKQQILLDQIRKKSFNLRQKKQKKEPVVQSVTNTSVAAILEKANAIKQALARHDEEYDKEDEWSDIA